MVAALAGLAGLAVGSFLNVVAHRVPAGRSVIRPPSACPACDHPIRPADNVPVVSWLLLRGRCRHCGARISLRYPLLELAGGLLFAATALVVGPTWTLPAYLWFAAVTLVLIVTDLDHHRLPNRIVYPGIAVGTLLLGAGAALEGALPALGRALGGGALYLVVLLAVFLAARGGFGFGDVKLAFLLGEFLAFRSWAVLGAGIFLGVALGGVGALLLLLAGVKGRKDPMPFGPAMVVGAWTAVAVGEPLVRWYLG